VADGVDYSGRYILAEVMNTTSIGPNLVLAPNAAQNDGKFELVLLPEEDREHFAQYLQRRINGEDASFSYRNISAKNILLQAQGTYAHTDDELLKVKKDTRINIQMLESVFRFYTGQQNDEQAVREKIAEEIIIQPS
jgi:diacylglycerol kinase (ATP)